MSNPRIIIVRSVGSGVECVIRGEIPAPGLRMFPVRPEKAALALNQMFAGRFLALVTSYLDEGAQFEDYETCGLYLRKLLASEAVEQFEKTYNLHMPTQEEKAAKLRSDEQDLFGL